MNEKLVVTQAMREFVARWLEQDGGWSTGYVAKIRSGEYDHADSVQLMAAHSAFIREAADKPEVKEAGARAVQERFPSDWDDIDLDDQREAIEWAEISFRAMFDQIERTPDEG